jgi:hypothetical protein
MLDTVQIGGTTRVRTRHACADTHTRTAPLTTASFSRVAHMRAHTPILSDNRLVALRRSFGGLANHLGHHPELLLTCAALDPEQLNVEHLPLLGTEERGRAGGRGPNSPILRHVMRCHLARQLRIPTADDDVGGVMTSCSHDFPMHATSQLVTNLFIQG